MPVSLLPALLLQILVVGYTPGPANILPGAAQALRPIPYRNPCFFNLDFWV